MLFVQTAFAVDTPRSCGRTNLNRFMHTGQTASAAPDKIYKFTEIRRELLASLENSQNTQCYADFYKQAIGEVGDYWGERLAQSGCEVDRNGRITGSCPDAGEARRSVEFVGNLDRELKRSIAKRLADADKAKTAAATAGDRDECEAKRSPAQILRETQDALCCGNASGGGVVRAVERGINYQTCLGKIRPTGQNFLSGSGLASCVGNAVKAALQQLWDNITAVFSLPGELWAARSQIWALITQPEARAQFARVLMQQMKSFFTDKVEAFKCYNDYEKAQYVCRMGGQLIATFATPSTIGSFLRLATQPAAAAMRAMSAMLSRSPGGGQIMAGIERANTAARTAAAAVGRAGRAVDDASGGRISAAGRVGDAIGRPLSAPIERIARSIEGSATFQRLFVNSFRAEKAAMGDARPNLHAKPDVIEGEVLPPLAKVDVAPEGAPRLERGQIIEGDFRVVPDADVPAVVRAADDVNGGAVRVVTPDGANAPRLPAPTPDDLPRLPPPESNSRALALVDNTPSRVADRGSPAPNSPRDFSASEPRAPPMPISISNNIPNNASRLPAPAEVRLLPAPSAPRVVPSTELARTGAPLPNSATVRAVTPNEAPANLAVVNSRVELPTGAGSNLPAGKATGFASNSGGSGGAIPVGSARSINPSNDSFARIANQNATVPAAGRNPVRAVVDSDATRPAPVRAAVDPNATRPVPARAVVDSDATVKRPVANLDDGPTVRRPSAVKRVLAEDPNALPKIEVRDVNANQIPDSFWDDIAREFKRDQEFTIRRTDAARDARTLAESQVKSTPVEKLKGRNISDEENILNDRVVRAGNMGGGVNDTYLVEFANGSRAVWKPHKKVWSSNYRAEVLAYEIDRMLGFNLVPPTVVRTFNGEVGSLQLFKNSSKIARPNAQSLNKQHFFDYLIDNRDRHSGNFLVAPNGNVISIDNGLSFTGLGHNKVPLRSRMPNLKEFVKTTEGKEILDNMKKVVSDPQFKDQIVDYLGKADAAKVIERMRYLIKLGDEFG